MRLRRRRHGRSRARHEGDHGEARDLKRVPIEDAFDLHSFRPEDVGSALDEYLAATRAQGFREVRIIHGKGIGVRRAEVRRRLTGREDIEEFFDAPPDRGGSGATIVRFR